MFIPSSAITPVVDPIERHRITSGRPASRVEILERHQREHRLESPVILPETSQPERVETRTAPAPLANVRRALSRVLINAGERIGPEAA